MKVQIYHSLLPYTIEFPINIMDIPIMVFRQILTTPGPFTGLHFTGNHLKELNAYFNMEQYIKPTSIKYDARIISSWEEMYNALDGGYTVSNITFANLCLYRFISLFMTPDVKINNNREQDVISKAIHFLSSNINKIYTVDELAAQFNYSASHFSLLFKHKTGRSPIEYFIQLKIHHACQLLDQSKLRINEISEKVGYDDPYYFSRLFTKIMGVSPNHYRKQKLK